MKKGLSFILGVLAGSLVGAGITLLLTPVSGENMRIEIKTYTQNVSNEVNLAAQQKREELEAQLAKLRQPKKS